jgi:hypothetical protein
MCGRVRASLSGFHSFLPDIMSAGMMNNFVPNRLTSNKHSTCHWLVLGFSCISIVLALGISVYNNNNNNKFLIFYFSDTALLAIIPNKI